MHDFFDAKSIITAFALAFIGFMLWTPLFYILPVVAIALFIFGIVKASQTDRPGAAVIYLYTVKYLAMPSVISILYILFTHIRFV